MKRSLSQGENVTSTTPATGSAARWGRLWGARPQDWAATEEQQIPTYEEAIRRVGVERGQLVLDIGCGAGVFLRLAADRGAEVFGFDASEALIEVARGRVPDADLRVGDMQFLPYEDATFDLVTGFNSFFFAADMPAAVREAGRVAKPGAPVVIQVWGRPEACDLEAMKAAVRPFRPPPPPGTPPEPRLWDPGVLEQIAADAGLTPGTAFDHTWAFEYPNDETLVRGMASAGGLAELVGPSGQEALRAALLDALAPYRTPSGGYRLQNEWHYLVAYAAHP
jgi:SAM-dependent methyltransferase